jgi:dipeptidase E
MLKYREKHIEVRANMAKKLILTSSGIDSQEIYDSLLKLLNKSPMKSSVAHIANAWDTEGDSMYPELSRENFRYMGFKVHEVDLRDLRGDELESKIGESDMIYVFGGNTYHLLDLFRKSGFDKMLPRLVESKVYGGDSAGSIVVGPDIRMARDSRVEEPSDFKGIGIVPFVVIPHYVDYEGIGLEGRVFVELARKELNPNPVIPISDGQAVVVVGDEHKVVGKTLTSKFMEDNLPEKRPENKEEAEFITKALFEKRVNNKLNAHRLGI